MSEGDGIECPCGIADLRVVRTTKVRGGVQRERRCKRGHRVFTLELRASMKAWIPRMSPIFARGSKERT